MLFFVVVVSLSHPVRVRGLKLKTFNAMTAGNLSHPVRVRGLKPFWLLVRSLISQSHPVRVRGLKHWNTYIVSTDINSRTPCGCVD